jgi:hypothetical protein
MAIWIEQAPTTQMGYRARHPFLRVAEVTMEKRNVRDAASEEKE